MIPFFSLKKRKPSFDQQIIDVLSYSFLIWFILVPLTEQPDYFQYHEAINRAEEYIVQEAFGSAWQELETVLNQYAFVFFDRIRELMDSEAGFPGEAGVGLDYAKLANKLVDCDAGNSKVIVTLLHYPYPIAEIGEELFIKAIAQGKLHPREFASIYTFEKQQVSILYRKTRRINRSLPTYHFNFPSAPKLDDLDKVNKDRARFGIGKYQVDQQKRAIEIKYGLQLRFGNDLQIN